MNGHKHHEVPDSEVDPTEEQVDALTGALVTKLLGGFDPVFIDTTPLQMIVRQVVTDTWLVANDTVPLAAFTDPDAQEHQ